MTVLYARKTKKIYILLSNTGTLLSKTIKLYTRVPYTHSSLVFDEGLGEIYSFGRKKPINPFIAGFVREDETGVYGHFKDTTCAIYELEVDHEIYIKMRNAIRSFEKDKEIYNYNLIGLLGIVINRPIKRSKSYFCTQFVYTVLEENGVKLFDKPAELVTPKDFQVCTKLHLVYQGKLLDYAPKLKPQVYSKSYKQQITTGLKDLLFRAARAL